MNRIVQSPWFIIVWPLLAAVLVGIFAYFIADNRANSKLNSNDQSLELWKIQPGLGTVMIEYAERFNNLWWAADGGNWDMATYQLNEMTEIQEVGETTRPARADALKKFEHDNLEPLMAAAKAKDHNAFVDAYDKAISGCNRCHGEQKDANGNTFRWIQIVRPTSTAPFSNVQFKAQ
jgi:hypothetical protein